MVTNMLENKNKSRKKVRKVKISRKKPEVKKKKKAVIFYSRAWKALLLLCKMERSNTMDLEKFFSLPSILPFLLLFVA